MLRLGSAQARKSRLEKSLAINDTGSYTFSTSPMRALSHLKKGYDQSLIVYNNTYYVNGGHEMPDRGTSKKITKIEGGETSGEARAFTPTAESKGQATKFRIIAVLSCHMTMGGL